MANLLSFYGMRKIFNGKEGHMQGCRTLTEGEVSDMLVSTKHTRDRLMILTCLYFGTRISEALELTFGSVSGESLYLKSKKRSKNQAFPIPELYRKEVERYKIELARAGVDINNDTLLFVSREGGGKRAITRVRASQIVREMCNRMGIAGRVNTHSFRKTFVTKIYEMTKFNIAETQSYSRHKSMANLEAYIATTEKTDLVNRLKW